MILLWELGDGNLKISKINIDYVIAYDFVALETIEIGGEMRWDYATVEYEIGNFPAQCLCGQKQCRSAVRGYKFSGEVLDGQYGNYIANYLKTSADR